MSFCAAFKHRYTPFLIAPLLGAVVSAATWLTTSAAGVSPLYSQVYAGAAFVAFAGLVAYYVNHCLSRFPRQTPQG